jgi:hypothetical protein
LQIRKNGICQVVPIKDCAISHAIRPRNSVGAEFEHACHLCSQATAGNYRVAIYGTRGLAETDRNLDAFRFIPAPDKPGHSPPAQPEMIEH